MCGCAFPRHHAIASWTTQAGRQPPFIAQTLPLTVDAHRLALHGERQAERGGRHRTDLRQPHWDRVRAKADSEASIQDSLPDRGTSATEPALPKRPPATASSPPGVLPALPRRLAAPPSALSASPPDSYRELTELDAAHTARWAKRVESRLALEPDPLDLEILALVAAMKHVLASQVHRRFNAGRAATTTQRRLKRLSDAGLVERFQFHRRDGGGVPMCYAVSGPGIELLQANDRLTSPLDGTSAVQPHSAPPPAMGERALRQARHDVHVAGWALALAELLREARPTLRGPAESVLSPPLHSSAAGRVALAPAELRLPGGRTPHDFLRTDGSGEMIEVERFETLRPDAVVEVSTAAVDVLVEFDDRLPIGRAAGKLERYDHFLAGWSVHTARYGRRRTAAPVVVFVCRDRARARECALRADATLRACRAYAGEYPFDWQYPGRERILFVSERDMHEGLAHAYGVAVLPPSVRVSAAHGDPRAGEAVAEPVAIPGAGTQLE